MNYRCYLSQWSVLWADSHHEIMLFAAVTKAKGPIRHRQRFYQQNIEYWVVVVVSILLTYKSII
jgi:hypothetical protein